MKRICFIIVSIVCFSLLHAESDSKGLNQLMQNLDKNAPVGRQYLVLIAIDKYKYWNPLENPVRDAKEIKEILQLNYYIDQVFELFDDNATKANIIKLFENLQKQLSINDSLLVYYSGHGHLDTTTNTGFWIPVNAGTDKYEQSNWLPNAQVRGIVSNIKAIHLLVVSDSCFSGDLLDSSRAIPEEIDDGYFKKAYARISRQILTSGASEAVPDASEFGKMLKMTLQKNTSQYLDPLMLYNDIRLGVKQTLPMVGNLKDTGHQDGASFILFLREKKKEAEVKQTEKAGDKAYGIIKVEAKEEGALFMDGKDMGSAKTDKVTTIDNVETGKHVVEIRYKDQTSEKKEVVIEEDKIMKVAFSRVSAIEKPQLMTDDMVFVEGGTFRMGSNDEDSNEKPIREVTVNSFYIMRCEVTQKKWTEVMGETQFSFPGDNLPVTNVTWFEAVEFCNKLSIMEGLTPCYSINGKDVTWWSSTNGYRLPTEAEWEYASRGGNKSRGYVYSGSDNIGDVAWYANNSGKQAHEVGGKKANELGIFDMSGNVGEWCWDWYENYKKITVIDPTGPSKSSNGCKVVRGGNFEQIQGNCTVLYRFALIYPLNYDNLSIGFRVVRTAN